MFCGLMMGALIGRDGAGGGHSNGLYVTQSGDRISGRNAFGVPVSGAITSNPYGFVVQNVSSPSYYDVVVTDVVCDEASRQFKATESIGYSKDGRQCHAEYQDLVKYRS